MLLYVDRDTKIITKFGSYMIFFVLWLFSVCIAHTLFFPCLADPLIVHQKKYQGVMALDFNFGTIISNIHAGLLDSKTLIAVQWNQMILPIVLRNLDI